jgi:hypothetical protein
LPVVQNERDATCCSCRIARDALCIIIIIIAVVSFRCRRQRHRVVIIIILLLVARCLSKK